MMRGITKISPVAAGDDAQALHGSKISFTDPDVVIAIDTVDDRAGIGLWTREELARHRLLRPD